MQVARRMARIPPYLFADLDRKREALAARGVDVINLSIGDPDLPTPEHIVEALARAARDARTHTYPPYEGTREFREAVASWYGRRFGVELDPDREVLALIGSKEGLAHLPWVVVDPGDVVLVSDPGYPVYATAALLAEGEPYPVPLVRERGWIPDLRTIPAAVARRARVFFLNYPNNPTAAVADLAVFEEVVDFARRHGVLVVHDNTYSEIAYDGLRPPEPPPGPRRPGRGGGVPLAEQDLLHDRLAAGLRRGQHRRHPRACDPQDQHRQRPVHGDPGRWRRSAHGAPGPGPGTGRRLAAPAGPGRPGPARGRAGRPDPAGDLLPVGPRPRGVRRRGVRRGPPRARGGRRHPGHRLRTAGGGYVRISLTARDDRVEEAVARISRHLRAPASR